MCFYMLSHAAVLWTSQVTVVFPSNYSIARCVPKGNNAEWAKVDVRSEGKACQAGASGQLDSLIADPCVCQNGGACTAGGTVCLPKRFSSMSESRKPL